MSIRIGGDILIDDVQYLIVEQLYAISYCYGGSEVCRLARVNRYYDKLCNEVAYDILHKRGVVLNKKFKRFAKFLDVGISVYSLCVHVDDRDDMVDIIRFICDNLPYIITYQDTCCILSMMISNDTVNILKYLRYRFCITERVLNQYRDDIMFHKSRKIEEYLWPC